MTTKEEVYLKVDWKEDWETADVVTNSPAVARRLGRLGYKRDEEGYFAVPLEALFPLPEVKRPRPEKTLEERIEHYFRLRRGKMQRSLERPLTEAEEGRLREEAERIVRDKARFDAVRTFMPAAETDLPDGFEDEEDEEA